MKGTFELRKPKPNYNSIWDVSVVLKYLGTFTSNEEQTLKNLTLKLVMLLLLVTAQRGQTIHCISLSEMTVSETSCEFQILEHMKISKPGSGTTIVKIEQYTHDKNVWPILVLREYLKTTKSVPVPRDTIST